MKSTRFIEISVEFFVFFCIKKKTKRRRALIQTRELFLMKDKLVVV